MEPIAGLKNAIRKYQGLRSSVLQLIQAFVNKTNQLTFVSSDLIQSSVGTDVKASRATFSLNDQLEELKASIASIQSDIAAVLLETMICKSKIKASSSVDGDFVCYVIGQIQQQQLLESTILDKIVGSDSSLIDQDSMVTMIACFEYPPYLREADVQALLSVAI